jgi:hypothetical protein
LLVQQLTNSSGSTAQNDLPSKQVAFAHLPSSGRLKASQLFDLTERSQRLSIVRGIAKP